MEENKNIPKQSAKKGDGLGEMGKGLYLLVLLLAGFCYWLYNRYRNVVEAKGEDKYKSYVKLKERELKENERKFKEKNEKLDKDFEKQKKDKADAQRKLSEVKSSEYNTKKVQELAELRNKFGFLVLNICNNNKLRGGFVDIDPRFDLLEYVKVKEQFLDLYRYSEFMLPETYKDFMLILERIREEHPDWFEGLLPLEKTNTNEEIEEPQP